MSFRNLRSRIGKKFSVKVQMYLVRILSSIFWSLRKYFLGVENDKVNLFDKNWQIIKKFSFIDKERNYNIYNLAKLHNEYFKNKKTHAIELGCARGSTLISMANFLHEECFIIKVDQFGEYKDYLKINNIFDNHYRDYNPFGKKEIFENSDFNQIFSFFKNHSIRENFKIIKGIFPNKLHENDLNFLNNLKFSFVHIDFDLYESTLNSLDFVLPKLKKNGILIIDDYNSINQSGVKQACKNSNLNLNKTFETSSGQLIFLNTED